MKKLLIVAAVLFVALPQARASYLDIFGFSPRAAGMAGAMTAASVDYTATYYNPAALGERKVVQIGGGLQLAASALSITRENASSEVANVLPPAHIGLTVGISAPLGGFFKHRVALWLSLFLPLKNVVRIEALDPKTPHFFLYQSLPEKIVLNLSGSLRLCEWLSLGLGFQVLSVLKGPANFEAEVVNRSITHREITVGLYPTAGVTAGLLLRIFKSKKLGILKFGASFRQSVEQTFNIPTRISLEGIGDIKLDIYNTSLQSPHQLAFGVSYNTPNRRWTFALDLTYELWSSNASPATLVDFNMNGGVIDQLGLGDTIDLHAGPIPLEASNVLIPRLGVEYIVSKNLSLRWGYHFRPTMLPIQVLYSNYVDNSAHNISVGVGITYKDPLKVYKQPVTIDISVQAAILANRRVVKADSNDMVGNYTSSGVVWSFAASIRHEF